MAHRRLILWPYAYKCRRNETWETYPHEMTLADLCTGLKNVLLDLYFGMDLHAKNDSNWS